MQIRNDYNSFSGRGYENPHTHHITKCLHEEEQTRQNGAAGGIRNDAVSSGDGEKAEQNGFYESGDGTGRKTTGGLKKGFGLIRGIWDSMGDEKEAGVITGNKLFSDQGVDAASSAIRHGLPYRIINKWESVRERIKTGLGTALKQFGRDRDTFSALSDPKGRFAGKRRSEGRYPEKTGAGTRRKEPDILTASQQDSYLLDSYSKTGEYCMLKENLTYQKNRGAEKPESRSKDE